MNYFSILGGTLEAVFKFNVKENSRGLGGDYSAGNYSLGFGYWSGALYNGFYNTYWYAIAAVNIPTGYFHLVRIYNRANIKTYINGVLMANNAIANLNIVSQTIKMGRTTATQS